MRCQRCAAAWPQRGADWPSGNAPTPGVRRRISRSLRPAVELNQALIYADVLPQFAEVRQIFPRCERVVAFDPQRK